MLNVNVKQIRQNEIVNINVGGALFATTRKTLSAVPDTKLSNISTSSAEYVKEINTYFYDRNPEMFNYILDFYRTGELHLPKHVCGASIRNELEFWLIAPSSIADCCVSSLFKFEDELDLTNNLKHQFESNGMEYSKDQLAASKWNRTMNVIWCFLDKPNSSRVARIFSTVYFLFVLLTCLVFILGTHKTFRIESTEKIRINDTFLMSLYDYMLLEHKNAKLALWGATDLTPGLEFINYICSIFFIIELFLKYIACPSKKQFFLHWLNIVDFIIVMSFIVAFILWVHGGFQYNTAMLYAYCVVRAMVILRLLRLFRLARHYSGLKVLYLALKASMEELGLLLLTFLITTSLFGGLIYYAEFFDAKAFDSVPLGIWWAIVTLTTVGYGDYYPVTPSGYVIGALCGMCGLLLLSMPIAIIATNFNDYYSRNKIREKQLKRKKDLLAKMRSLFAKKNIVSVIKLDNIASIPGTARSEANGDVMQKARSMFAVKAKVATPAKEATQAEASEAETSKAETSKTEEGEPPQEQPKTEREESALKEADSLLLDLRDMEDEDNDDVRTARQLIITEPKKREKVAFRHIPNNWKKDP